MLEWEGYRPNISQLKVNKLFNFQLFTKAEFPIGNNKLSFPLSLCLWKIMIENKVQKKTEADVTCLMEYPVEISLGDYFDPSASDFYGILYRAE